MRTLLEDLGRLESVVVAYSGGVDSSYLLWAAYQALGDRCLGVTAVSPSLAASDRERARRVAAWIGAPFREIDTSELEDEGYRRNGADRCYFCKRELFSKLSRLARQEGYATLAYGAITDDLGDHRPGARAAAEFGVLAPLCRAGLSKADVRRLSREVGLPTWDQPSQPCLASRLAYGTAVTPERLSAVEEAEEFLRARGFRDCRVRDHAGIARIEVPLPDLERLCQAREQVVERLKGLGFVYVTVDLAGLRSGSMNEMLRLRVVP